MNIYPACASYWPDTCISFQDDAKCRRQRQRREFSASCHPQLEILVSGAAPVSRTTKRQAREMFTPSVGQGKSSFAFTAGMRAESSNVVQNFLALLSKSKSRISINFLNVKIPFSYIFQWKNLTITSRKMCIKMLF
jgi:hypothetical protein